ncbi:LysR family transcriptional regulator [Aliiglaciecola sp. 2_MG-2023]|uniref:LysR family transcriptional regulator n=1 Tax=unclassified Aliiglaciecola TaxID=2593648 RepID=UPI0026E373C2|nr:MULTISPECIES: LysR family transcriptional regulator [unclassified Aliiglaciecola]MDO6711553.1 LysR family transcriptional regulator [Aliiglaciecola sp. 2_MG-2023]MDO6752624.1 LysR family transcriptional regulator [Aliiglaciecola sp. 1_MG-2023]
MLLEDLNVILKVAEFRNITAAAESLDMRTATASAAIKRVERALGVELFIRTTRHLRLSVAGEKYIPNCEQALQLLNFAKQNVKEDLDVIDGELRISVPSDLGRNLILPWLDEFMHEHAGVSVKLHISDSNIDFYRDPVDIALRYGTPNDANLYGFKICKVPRVICATTEYLKNNGFPQHPNDLTTHNGLLYQLHDIIHDVWEFDHNEKSIKVKVQSNRASNDAELVRRWCVNGKGIATKSSLDMSNDLLNDKVVPILKEFAPKPTELWLICPSRQTITPAVRLLREHFRIKCAEVFAQLINKGVLTQENIK